MRLLRLLMVRFDNSNPGGGGNNLQNSIFNLNNVSFDQITGDFIEAGGSTLSGSGVPQRRGLESLVLMRMFVHRSPCRP